MRLAEALIERADLQRKQDAIGNRLNANALVLEGETPSENPEFLLAELNAVAARAEELITRINLTNAATLDDGDTLTALLARRDCQKAKIMILQRFIAEAVPNSYRSTRTEIPIRSTVSVPTLRTQADALSKSLRELEIRIQRLNWETDLI